MSAEVIPFPRPYLGLLSKRQLARAIQRSTRWIEIQQRLNGLPFTRDEAGYCRYRLEEVREWKVTREAESG